MEVMRSSVEWLSLLGLVIRGVIGFLWRVDHQTVLLGGELCGDVQPISRGQHLTLHHGVFVGREPDRGAHVHGLHGEARGFFFERLDDGLVEVLEAHAPPPPTVFTGQHTTRQYQFMASQQLVERRKVRKVIVSTHLSSNPQPHVDSESLEQTQAPCVSSAGGQI